MTTLFAPAVSVAAATLLAVTARMGSTALAVAVALLVVLLGVGWSALLDLRPARWSTAAVIAVSGLAAVALAVLRQGADDPLAPFAVLLAGCVLLAFVHQLARRDGREQLVESLTSTVSGQVLAVLAAGWILVPRTTVDVPGVLVAAVATTVAVVVVAMPLDAGVRGWAAFGIASVVSVIAAVVLATGTVLPTALIGIVVSAVVAGTTVLFQGQDLADRLLAVPAAGIGPVCAAGTMAYAVGRLAGGG